jgi:predicted PurR-regulated permease PerM
MEQVSEVTTGRRLRARDGTRDAIPRGLVVLLGIAAATVAGAGIHALAWLIGPVFLALTLVIVVSPVRRRMVRAGLPGWLATLVLVIAVYAVMLGLAFAVVFSLTELISQLPKYSSGLNDIVKTITDRLSGIGAGGESLRTIAGSLDVGKVTKLALTLLSGVTGLASNLLFLLSLLLFMAVETGATHRRLAVIAEDRPVVAGALNDFVSSTRTYMMVTTVFGLIIAVADTIALWLLGIPLALLWGVLAFVTGYIPNIGFIIGVAPPALLALLTGGWKLAVAVVVIYAVLNFVVQSIIQPKFVSGAVGLSMVVSFLSLVFWAWLIGPLGAVLAVPLTLLAKAMLVDIDPRARWADALLNQAPPEKKPVAEKPAESPATDDAPPPVSETLQPTPPARA